MSPKVSIVVPVFNGSKFVERNSGYILEQTYKNFEVIFVVDSRTTDDSISMIEERLRLYPSASVVVQEGGGVGEAKNIGIDRAKGELVWFLDIDDRPLPHCLNTLVGVQEEYNADVAILNYIRSSKNDPVIKIKSKDVVRMDRYEALDARGKNRIPVTSWSMMTRADLIRNNGLRFIPNEYFEDIDFANRLLTKADVICFCREPLLVYVQNPDSICGAKKNNERGADEIRSYRRLMEYMEKNEPEYAERFRRNAVSMIMRSSTRMDAAHFIGFAKDPDTRATLKSVRGNLETGLFRLFPRLYRAMARIYMKFIFYREGKTF